MKFQAAAMGRANVPESERQDFALFVDEFQNFATDSFESILSEARKYRLNLVLGNQFMTQLTEKIREAIIGNVGTVVSGRIGITDAEVLIKKFAPTFETEDLTKMPNHESITSVMINNVPSAPFSMSWIAPMGESNMQLNGALKRLSAAKYGKPRALVEKAIFDRLGAADKEKADRLKAIKKPGLSDKPSSGSSFLDEWLAKRQQLGGAKPTQATEPVKISQAQPLNQSASQVAAQPTAPVPTISNQTSSLASPTEPSSAPETKTDSKDQSPPDKLHLRGEQQNDDNEIAIKLR